MIDRMNDTIIRRMARTALRLVLIVSALALGVHVLDKAIPQAALDAVCFAPLKSDGPDDGKAIKSVAQAERELNDALFDFAHSSAPNANRVARDRMVALRGQAEAAVAALEAKLALRKALGPFADMQPIHFMAPGGLVTTAQIEAYLASWPWVCK